MISAVTDLYKKFMNQVKILTEKAPDDDERVMSKIEQTYLWDAEHHPGALRNVFLLASLTDIAYATVNTDYQPMEVYDSFNKKMWKTRRTYTHLNCQVWVDQDEKNAIIAFGPQSLSYSLQSRIVTPELMDDAEETQNMLRMLKIMKKQFPQLQLDNTIFCGHSFGAARALQIYHLLRPEGKYRVTTFDRGAALFNRERVRTMFEAALTMGFAANLPAEIPALVRKPGAKFLASSVMDVNERYVDEAEPKKTDEEKEQLQNTISEYLYPTTLNRLSRQLPSDTEYPVFYLPDESDFEKIRTSAYDIDAGYVDSTSSMTVEPPGDDDDYDDDDDDEDDEDDDEDDEDDEKAEHDFMIHMNEQAGLLPVLFTAANIFVKYFSQAEDPRVHSINTRHPVVYELWSPRTQRTVDDITVLEQMVGRGVHDGKLLLLREQLSLKNYLQDVRI